MKKKISLAILLLFVACLAYLIPYYHADVAVEAIAQKSNITKSDNYTIISPSTNSDTALIFYPGGKVDENAYLPLLETLSQNGITCVLVKMPFHLAVFDANAADNVFALLPNIKNWYIGGHSLGGAMASNYTAKNADKIDGLVLLGAYIYGDIDASKTITIYGSNDTVLNKEKITYTENVHIIDGGNHAQFGSYGFQKGDGIAEISAEEQKAITVELIVEFIS